MLLCLVTLIFDLEINGFPGLIVDHVCDMFSDPGCVGSCDIV